VIDHRPVPNIANKSGWEKSLDKKLAPPVRVRRSARLFCVMVNAGKWHDWTPYTRPKTAHQLQDWQPPRR